MGEGVRDSTTWRGSPMVGAMWERLQKLLDRVESRYALYLAATARGGTVVGVGAVSGMLSSGVAWLNQFGWFGWWAAFLLGAFLTSVVFALLAWTRNQLASARAKTKWSESVSDFNPLDADFSKKRLLLSGLVDPITNAITGKNFTNCDLIGPINLVLSDKVYIMNSQFRECDMVMVKVGEMVFNCSNLEDTNINKCRIYKATLFITEAMAHGDFSAPGMQPVIGMNRANASLPNGPP